MFHKIKDVRALQNNKLSVQFIEGKTKIYDINNLINNVPMFKKLGRNEKSFYSYKNNEHITTC